MEIPDIKSKLTIREVLHHYNLHPDRNNRLNCPFHPDKTPSLQIYPKTETAYCFSSNCKTHGKSFDVIDFVMYMEHFDKLSDRNAKHEAIIKAQELAGGKPQEPKPTNGQDLSRSAGLTKIFGYFKKGLASSKPAREYAATDKLAWSN